MSDNKTPELLTALTEELHLEIIVNEDSTRFWTNAQETVFNSSLASFRESLSTLQEALSTDIDGMNYFSSMAFRLFTNPVTRPALESFCKSFDEISRDAIFGASVTYSAKDLSLTEQLLLFITVHRSSVQLAVFTKEKQNAAQRQAELEVRKEALRNK